ncbi:MAG: hypothetical protein E6I93_09810 [Chloroflexi bacterium]|nr:MAG: hypothetical protein E6I93_09810 [Chloroflexota bacterium]
MPLPTLLSTPYAYATYTATHTIIPLRGLESIKVNGALITRGNVSADNGIIHVIDKVLVPRFMVL